MFKYGITKWQYSSSLNSNQVGWNAFNEQYENNVTSVNITEHRPAVSHNACPTKSAAGHNQTPNTSGPAGIKISQCPVKWLSLLRPRWTDSCCTPWSIIILGSVAVGQLCSVKQSATVPSSPCTSPSSPAYAERWQNGQMGEEWG